MLQIKAQTFYDIVFNAQLRMHASHQFVKGSHVLHHTRRKMSHLGKT